MAAVGAGAMMADYVETESDKLLRTLDAVITAARESASNELPDDWRIKVATRVVEFDAVAAPAALNVFLFHQSVSADTKAVSTVDIKGLDHSKFDYDLLIKRNVSIALWSNPGSRVVLVTDSRFLPSGFDDPRV